MLAINEGGATLSYRIVLTSGNLSLLNSLICGVGAFWSIFTEVIQQIIWISVWLLYRQIVQQIHDPVLFVELQSFI